MILTKEQRQALKRVFNRMQGDDKPKYTNYRAMRRNVCIYVGGDCIGLNLGYIWIGIEKDGYTHS